MKLSSFPSFLQKLSSLKLTTVLLCLLAILTFFGTLYQAENGLYAAQQKFFYSWLFRWYVSVPFTDLRIWFPFVGGASVLFGLTLNLLAGLIVRFRWKWSNSGLALSHLGLLVLLLGGAWTHYQASESAMTLNEGESKAFGESTQKWELAIWKKSTNTQTVFARDMESLPIAQNFNFTDGQLPIQIQVDSFFVNSTAYGVQPGIPDNQFVNVSNIALIQEAKPEKEPSQNQPGMVLHVLDHGKSKALLLHAFDIEPTVIRIGSDLYAFQLRRSRLHLPFNVQLIDFKRVLHGGTGMAKKYESLIKVSKSNEHPVQALIAMNEPLRKDGYIFYQASFGQGEMGAEISTFSVVQNEWRLLPYVSSLMMGFGLLFHFGLKMRTRRKSNP